MTSPPPLRMGLVLVQAVTSLSRRVRRFYYKVVLLGHACPACGSALSMQRDDLALCQACGNALDPTIEFQHCDRCGGRLRRNVSRYQCTLCGAPAPSRFAFDPPAFNREYYARRMRESRNRKRKQKSQRHQRLILARSRRVLPDTEPRLDDVPGLSDALDSLAELPLPRELITRYLDDPEWDMTRYRAHILENTGYYEALFDRIPPLLEDARRDRIFRFVACVFMCHEGEVRLVQQDDMLVIERNEPDREGQGIP